MTTPFNTATPKSAMKPTPAEMLKGIVLRKNSVWLRRDVRFALPNVRNSLSKVVVAQEAPMIIGFQPVVEVNLVQIGRDHFFAEFMSFRT